MGAFTPLDELGFHPALVIFTGAGCSSCRVWKQFSLRITRNIPPSRCCDTYAAIFYGNL